MYKYYRKYRTDRKAEQINLETAIGVLEYDEKGRGFYDAGTVANRLHKGERLFSCQCWYWAEPKGG